MPRSFSIRRTTRRHPNASDICGKVQVRLIQLSSFVEVIDAFGKVTLKSKL